MNVYVVMQHEFNENNQLYTDVIDAVEVFVDRYYANQFIKEMKELDKDEGYDYAYFIKTFEL